MWYGIAKVNYHDILFLFESNFKKSSSVYREEPNHRKRSLRIVIPIDAQLMLHRANLEGKNKVILHLLNLRRNDLRGNRPVIVYVKLTRAMQ
ncbi:MAG: hypothetical protein RSF40_04805 [Oscillospiraceae bacterium]